MSFWDIIWFIVVSFAFVAYLMVMFSIIGDLFRDHTVSGVAKAVWIVALILFPLVTSIVYLVVRGDGMAQRSRQQFDALRRQQEDHIRAVAGGSSPVEEIARGKQLLDSGALTAQEFEALKAKVLAAV